MKLFRISFLAKLLFLFSLNLIITQLSFSQSLNTISPFNLVFNKDKTIDENKLLLKDLPRIDKFSNFTKLFISDLILDGYQTKTDYIPSLKIRELYPLGLINKKYYTGALLLVNNLFNENELKNYGVLIGSRMQNILSVKIPIENVIHLSQINGIDFIEIDIPVRQQLDKARSSTSVDYVHQGYQLPWSLTGEGTIVGIIDDGFDFTHPIFNDTNNNKYRIKRLWDMGDTIGPPPNGYNYGTEIVGDTNIKSRLYDIRNNSHGVHVAGIAAGGFSGNENKFKGFAPNSDIIVVANPNARGSLSSFVDGINYIFNQATLLNKPAVVNLSWNSQIGPHDGKSLFDRTVDLMVGPGKIVVGSVGNNGIYPIHLKKTFTNSDTMLLTLLEFPHTIFKTRGKTIIEIWGDPDTTLKFYVGIYNIYTGNLEDHTPLISSTFNGVLIDTLYDNDPSGPDRCYLKITTTYYSLINGKTNIQIDVNNIEQYKPHLYVILGMMGKNSTIHAWTEKIDDIPAYFVDRSLGPPFKSGDNNYTMGEIGGTGRSIISVGAFTTKNSYIDFLGRTQYISYYTLDGDIAPFSSRGPTVDGRIKPDITAPGNVIVSAISNYDTNFSSNSPEVVARLLDSSGTWWFAAFDGTSMSAPVVTGIIALILETRRYFNTDQVKEILRLSAYKDGLTGITPNNTWGWGKVDAFSALKRLADWKTYTIKNSALPAEWISKIKADNQGNIWIGAPNGSRGNNNAGLIKFDGQSWTLYNQLNSGMPYYYVTDINIDQGGNKWIGTTAGLAKFDGTNWIQYNTPTLPDNHITSIDIDEEGNKWISTMGGLAKFDDSVWTIYKTSNSGLPADHVTSIAFDLDGKIWIGTYTGGLAKFDGVNWTVYNTSNSQIPSDLVLDIIVDSLNNKWIATMGQSIVKFDGNSWTSIPTIGSTFAIDNKGKIWAGTAWGLAKIDGTNITYFTVFNSGLIYDYNITSIAVDKWGNLWIGHGGLHPFGGISVFREGGIITSTVNEMENNLSTYFELYQNYPNPFNNLTKIRFRSNSDEFISIKIYDILGRELVTLIDELREKGLHEIEFDAGALGLSTGIYFYRLKAGAYAKTRKMILLK